MTCEAKSVRLNCGCCDEVHLLCDLDNDHSGDHAFSLEEWDYAGLNGDRAYEHVTYRIEWKETDRRKITKN